MDLLLLCLSLGFCLTIFPGGTSAGLVERFWQSPPSPGIKVRSHGIRYIIHRLRIYKESGVLFPYSYRGGCVREAFVTILIVFPYIVFK